MDTRPTTDKVKESMFNIIQFEIEGRKVLDLFGAPAAGIEALSRGAQRCTFVDQRREAAALIRENLKMVGFEDRAKVVQGESLSFLSACREKFDVIFLDPPYQSGLLEKCVAQIVQFDILGEYGIIVCESPAEWNIPRWSPPMRRGENTGTARSS